MSRATKAALTLRAAVSCLCPAAPVEAETAPAMAGGGDRAVWGKWAMEAVQRESHDSCVYTLRFAGEGGAGQGFKSSSHLIVGACI